MLPKSGRADILPAYSHGQTSYFGRQRDNRRVLVSMLSEVRSSFCFKVVKQDPGCAAWLNPEMCLWKCSEQQCACGHNFDLDLNTNKLGFDNDFEQVSIMIEFFTIKITILQSWFDHNIMMDIFPHAANY